MSKQVQKKLRKERCTDLLHDAIRRHVPWGDAIEPSLGMRDQPSLAQSWAAITALRNLSFHEGNSKILAAVMCAPVAWTQPAGTAVGGFLLGAC